MATPTASNDSKDSKDWLKMKQLIFANDTYLNTLSSSGLFLFLIGSDLDDILDGKTGRDFHLLLTLAHGKESLSERFPKTLAADDDMMVSLKTSLRDGDKIDETKAVLKIDADGTTVHLHLHGLLHPGAAEGEMCVSSDAFATNEGGHPETVFLSTHDISKPVDQLEFCWTCSKTGSEDGNSVDGLVVDLSADVCPDHNRTWISKK
ncbi:hypothetical protein ColTof4_01189 [Colletotrichum tofieldiae]|nr:hypothetical protein ColTof3_08419 [Colletotrichum tofieldiae]GKT68766.1 hypothetical protein ColTof4_01189 [Colletotrichum tofieldiae]GKT88615.1 hypothetical protein Ct61P_06465 [Colletotrichum tofieldiae]